jgi:flagellar protein FlgJ
MNIEALAGGVYGGGGLLPFASYGETARAGRGAAQGTGGFERLLEQAQSAREADAADASPARASPPSARIDKTDKLYEQCEALETFLVKNLIKSMQGTIQKTNLIDTGLAGEIYEGMLYDEYAKDFTKNARLGFAELAYLELSGQRRKTSSC